MNAMLFQRLVCICISVIMCFYLECEMFCIDDVVAACTQIFAIGCCARTCSAWLARGITLKERVYLKLGANLVVVIDILTNFTVELILIAYKI